MRAAALLLISAAGVALLALGAGTMWTAAIAALITVLILSGPTRERVMRAPRRARRAHMRRRDARAREARALREARIHELEREVFEEHRGCPSCARFNDLSGETYHVRVRDGKRYHVYDDRAVFVGSVDAV